jgi:hypothetical protein
MRLIVYYIIYKNRVFRSPRVHKNFYQIVTIRLTTLCNSITDFNLRLVRVPRRHFGKQLKKTSSVLYGDRAQLYIM